MEENIRRFFDFYPGTPKYDTKNFDYRCSIKCSDFRLNKAKEQVTFAPTNVNDIIMYVNEFLEAVGMKRIENPIVRNPLSINYQKLKTENKLKSKKDIVWMKFTVDGYLGVIAQSNDINFAIPLCKSEYRLVQEYTTAGILVHQLHKEWDKSFVLLFPLIDIPKEYKRGDIERAIGNYLIENNVPIIDFYSHNY